MTATYLKQDLRGQKLWYFAYGSNMSTAKFTGSRGIQPLDAARVYLPGWVLTFEIPGLPYSEPAFSSIRPVNETPELGAPNVTGTAYLITHGQYRNVIASEGGGTAYTDILVDARPVGGKDASKTGEMLQVRTLGPAMTRCPPARPSQRYMSIINSGAVEAGLPTNYQQYLNGFPTYCRPDHMWQRLGASIFTAVWSPVMYMMEYLVHVTVQRNGNAPFFVILFVRWTMGLIWFTHDMFFSPVYGRGDGLIDDGASASETYSLLCDKTSA